MAKTEEYREEAVGMGCSLEEFKEREEIEKIIVSIPVIYQDQIAVEMAFERFLFIVDQYQEQPHLLDPHLEKLLGQLLDIVKDTTIPTDVMHLAFKMLYLITKTRGYKIILRLMPHEVADLDPLLALLDQQDPMDFKTWETRYMLLLWLSIVCMIPFDMYRLDSQARSQGHEGKKLTMDRIIESCKRYVNVSDKSRDATAYALSRFMTRPDVKKVKLPEFIDWCLTMLRQAKDMPISESMSLTGGVLATLALLMKTGKREDILEYGTVLLDHISELKLSEASNTLIRKFAMKLIQRIGLTFLKAKLAAWRYQRGSRSLAENLAPAQTSSDGLGGTVPPAGKEPEEDYDIPEEMEQVIELLLTGLKDKDTVVRWSAAKGIGRVTMRLPKELADEVVGSLMGLFTITEGDAAWHGGCLALAELGRRGLLLPERLPEVVPTIIKALGYDEKRGNFSVGAHVRDAACYVCWAFARAYDPEQIQDHVQKISNALVIVSIFDREVNVRRAASAAFQENVGRQGTWPHGIDILTNCDYFAVGNRNHCYEDLSVFVAQFSEYTQGLLDHLVDVKIGHWDKSVRELASVALHRLACRDRDHVTRVLLPKLVAKSRSTEVVLRHGAILSAAEIVHALAQIARDEDKQITDLIDATVVEDLKNIAIKLEAAKLYRGLGGELMREAVCHLIKKLSQSGLVLKDDPVRDTWQGLLDDCLQHKEVDIQKAAVEAIPAFCTHFYQTSDGKPCAEVQEALLTRYLAQLKAKFENVSCGFALAVGALPRALLQGHFHTVIRALVDAITIDDSNRKWAEARRDATIALTSVCLTVGSNRTGDPSNEVCAKNVGLIFDALFDAMKDYTLDSRGDVGAWVREASMTGLHAIATMLAKSDPALLSEDISRTMFQCLIQQSCEKIDRTRAHAADLFVKLLHDEPPIPHIPHRNELRLIFDGDDVRKMNWAVPANSFPRFVTLMTLESYTYAVLLGMTVSVGGLTESLVRSSSAALLAYLRDIALEKEKLKHFATMLLQLFEDHLKTDRVTLPMFKMLNQLLANNCFETFPEEEINDFTTKLYGLCKKAITKSGDPQKLLASSDVFCCLLQFPGDVRKKAMLQLMIFLCHRFPIVRKTTSQSLYEALVTFDDIVSDENLDEIMNILSETQWDHAIDEIKPLRNQLCDLIGVEKPVTLKRPAAADNEAN